MLEALVQQVSAQLEIKRRELELQQQTDRNNFEYAKLGLAAQQEDRQRQRQHEKTQEGRRYLFAGAITVLILAFIVYTLQTGKEQFAADALKLLVGFVSGSASGYFYGRRKGELDARGDTVSGAD
jgi:hypothetical protein